MRIAIAGSGRLGWSLMEPLLESHHEIVAVLQDGRRTRGFMRRVVTAHSATFGANTTMIGLAKSRRIPVMWIDRLTEENLSPLRALQPDLILVGGFGVIFKKIILELPRLGCANCHSSMLPKHRGPNPFAAVILQGDTESAVTFHMMDEGIDTGDILEQYPYPVGPDDTPLTVYANACTLAYEHVLDVVDRIEHDGLHGTPQNSAVATYDKQLDRAISHIDWRRPAIEIERIVRIFKTSTWARFRFRGRDVYLSMVKADPTPVDAEPGTVLASGTRVRVAAGEGSIEIVLGYKTRPIPWVWPTKRSCPRVGERLE